MTTVQAGTCPLGGPHVATDAKAAVRGATLYVCRKCHRLFGVPP